MLVSMHDSEDLRLVCGIDGIPPIRTELLLLYPSNHVLCGELGSVSCSKTLPTRPTAQPHRNRHGIRP